ncbi:MAG: glutaminase A [Rubrivivax sp.]|nr:glutaminase A [Rubrivivax sp.]
MPASNAPTSPVSPVQAYLEALHRELCRLDSGQVATYIPELAKALPASFGIAIATVDGQVYEVGDTRQAFTIQSVSKPMTYGLALQDRGAETVRRKVGVEPSGEAFNSISLEPGTGRPLNPMINAGAIAMASLVQGDTLGERLQRVLDTLSAYAGRPLSIDEAVFESERSTGHRNRAIGHLLRNCDIIETDPEPALELYFRQCSVLVTGRDLALMGATLANGGVNPLTQQRALAADCVGPVLSVMTTCGVYDFTGEWVWRVGLPAKSGVGGGVIAVLPGQLGIGIFSPPLDERGNSVRGVAACEAISRDLGLHFLQPPRPSASTVRARYTLASVRSKRRRPAAESRWLDAHGERARVFELQGDLRFTTLEPVLRELAQGDWRVALLDFKRVSRADPAATRLIAGLAASCVSHGRRLVLSRVRRGELLAGLDRELASLAASAVEFQPELDLGLEWCERLLLREQGATPAAAPPTAVDGLEGHLWCEGMTAAERQALRAPMQRLEFDPGDPVVHIGEPADALFFLLQGEVSVVLPLPQGGVRRLQTLSAGMGFGEAALIAGGQRGADVRADTPVVCLSLSAAAFAQIQDEEPRLAARLLLNLLKATTRTAQRLTAEVAALEG